MAARKAKLSDLGEIALVDRPSRGIDDPQVNTMFMNSAGHRANILGPYHYVGTAWVVAPNGAAYIAVEFS